MKFLSTRDLRNRPGVVRDLMRNEDVVLTSNGKPVALLMRVEEDDLEETARAIRQARAQQALSRMRREAAEHGLDNLGPEFIEREIRVVRTQRKSR